MNDGQGDAGASNHPSPELVSRACREAIPGVSVLSIRQLHGGQTTLTHAVRVETPADQRQWLILRRWPPRAWVRRPDKRAVAEHTTLMALESIDLPTPRALWLDKEGRIFGVPATIQTRLTGRASWPEAIPEARAAQMGQALKSVHACRPPRQVPDSRFWVERFLAHRRPPPPFRDAHPAMERMWKALRSAGKRPLERKNVLLHGDYHGGNTLWARGRLSGIVDWETAEAGPRGRDLGYTRMDCTITGGRKMASGLSDGYGLEVEDLWFWELLAAVEAAAFYRDWQPAWRHFDLGDLDLRTVRRRLDGFVDRALKAT